MIRSRLNGLRHQWPLMTACGRGAVRINATSAQPLIAMQDTKARSARTKKYWIPNRIPVTPSTHRSRALRASASRCAARVVYVDSGCVAPFLRFFGK
jgi:hypothetical protein